MLSWYSLHIGTLKYSKKPVLTCHSNTFSYDTSKIRYQYNVKVTTPLPELECVVTASQVETDTKYKIVQTIVTKNITERRKTHFTT